MSNIFNFGNTFGSEEIIEMVDQFEADHEDMLEALALHPRDKALEASVLKLSSVDDEEWARYSEAKKINDESSGGDWEDGVMLIRDDYFTEYAQDLCAEIGDVSKNLPSYIEIDWDATAKNIQQDYTSVDIGDDTYWYRS